MKYKRIAITKQQKIKSIRIESRGSKQIELRMKYEEYCNERGRKTHKRLWHSPSVNYKLCSTKPFI